MFQKKLYKFVELCIVIILPIENSTRDLSFGQKKFIEYSEELISL